MLDGRTHDEQQEIAHHLAELSTGAAEPSTHGGGICDELYDKFTLPNEESAELFLGWGEHSGHRGFPIRIDSSDPWSTYLSSENHWADDAYGDARRRLCAYAAEKIRTRLRSSSTT